MRREEELARDLTAELGSDATALGSGVHWRVELKAGARSVVVQCFWYDIPARVGPEYLVIVRDGSVALGSGRTAARAEAVAAARIWARGEAFDVLVHDAPFIDSRRRVMRAIARDVPPGLRWDIAPEPGCELWVYGEGRSCCATLKNNHATWTFLLGQAPVARAAGLANVGDAIAAWLLEQVPIATLASRIPETQLDRHAQYLDSDPARAHWLEVLDRAEKPDDALAPHRDLVQACAANPAISRFYSFTSLSRLCFTASSHYPWVNEGLPNVSPTPDGRFVIDQHVHDLDGALATIERRLAASPIRPFFGCEAHHLLPQLAAHLRWLRSAAVPAIIQQHAWPRLVVQTETRTCQIDRGSVEFSHGDGKLLVTYPSLELAAAAIHDYLDAGATFDTLAASHQAESSYRR
jgi:hypothetical protein